MNLISVYDVTQSMVSMLTHYTIRRLNDTWTCTTLLGKLWDLEFKIWEYPEQIARLLARFGT
jgi:hypothetical protein